MNPLKKCGIIALYEIGIFGLGYGVSIMFPYSSAWIWFVISGGAFIAAYVLWNWPEAGLIRKKTSLEKIKSGLRKENRWWKRLKK